MMKRLIERILCAYCGLSVEDGLSAQRVYSCGDETKPGFRTGLIPN